MSRESFAMRQSWSIYFGDTAEPPTRAMRSELAPLSHLRQYFKADVPEARCDLSLIDVEIQRRMSL